MIEAALAVANGRPVPDAGQAAFERLPKVMARADGLAGQISRAVIDLAEAVALEGREGEKFAAVVTDTDQRGARFQITSPPVVARIKVDGLVPGQELTVRLNGVDTVNRTVNFSIAS